MDVPDRLATIPTAVKHATIAAFGNPKGFRQIPRGEVHMPKQFGIRGLNIQQAGDVLAWDHQGMRRCLGMNVAEGHNVIILMQELRL